MPAEWEEYARQGIRRLQRETAQLIAHQNMEAKEGWSDEIGQILSQVLQQITFDFEDRRIVLTEECVRELSFLWVLIIAKAGKHGFAVRYEWIESFNLIQDLLYDKKGHMRRYNVRLAPKKRKMLDYSWNQRKKLSLNNI